MWIKLVLQRAGIPDTIESFTRGIVEDSTTVVEHVSVARSQLAMMRGEATLLA